MSAKRDLPEFVRDATGRRTVLVHPDFMPQVANAMLDGQGVWPTGVTGRGNLLRCATPRGDVLVREYLRGGLVARWVRDRYLLDNRPLRELRAHQHAWRAGVPTVMPVGAMWERSGIWLWGAYATLEAPGEDLLSVVKRELPDELVLASCGHAIRLMHDAGIVHDDLQIKNIFISSDRALILDFDGARVLKRVPPRLARRNLERLKRSFVKRGIELDYFGPIAKAYSR